MALIVEPRHRIVRLRRQPRAGDALLGEASNTGNRPARMRPCTSAVMNTVLPARDSPVMPSRTVGLNRPSAIFDQGARGEPGLFEEIGEGCHGEECGAEGSIEQG